MSLQKLCNVLSRWWFRRSRRVEGALHSSEEFRTLLERERMRADRSRTSITLVVFTLPARESDNTSFASFVERLAPRLRATDHAGIVGERRIGVVLWDTSEAGARKFADDVCSPSGSLTPPRCDLYLYPTHQPPSFRSSSGIRKPVRRPIGKDLVGVIAGSGWSPPEASEALKSFQVRLLESLLIQPSSFWKRAMDAMGAAMGLVLLSPLLLATAATIKMTSAGPVLFAQRREGLGGKPFTIYKFRTMHTDAEQKQQELRQFSEQDGPAFKLRNDPRITPLGRYLRKTCIDELPQLWNVLKGEMSLVGPRPLPCEESQQCRGWERRRLEVTPGLTCIWQVYGKSAVSFAEWMRMDIRYIRSRTLLHDIKLIWCTLVAVILHRASH